MDLKKDGMMLESIPEKERTLKKCMTAVKKMDMRYNLYPLD